MTDLPKNARVDALGRSHEGRCIYRVIVDGVKDPLYLVDATASINELKNVNVSGAIALLQDALSLDPNSELFVGDSAPPLRGNMSCGLNAKWVEWYRNQGNGHSLREARDEGLRRLAEILGTDQSPTPPPPAPEPALRNDRGRPNLDWVKWYKEKHGCSLREAHTTCESRISQLRAQ